MNQKQTPILAAISIGDYMGIGMEVILKAFKGSLYDVVTPIVFADIAIGKHYAKRCNINNNLQAIKNIADAKPNYINFLSPATNAKIVLKGVGGTKDSGLYAYDSLSAATDALKAEEVGYLVTAPIDKSNIQGEKFHFAGHTEYLESAFEGNALMILCSEKLRVGLVTGHIPISAVAKAVTPEKISQKARLMYQSLESDFGIEKPRLAMLSLNPHCGDKGVIGTEDDKIINPTIQNLQKEGLQVEGVFAADGFFGSGCYQNFDGILAMYHDQGLASFKALSFGKGVNFTAGLSNIRTSPDHGTAFDIAGKNIADESSFSKAVLQGYEIYQNRYKNKK